MRCLFAVRLGAEIGKANVLISVAHFKGHELTGFGGALKNIGREVRAAGENWRNMPWLHQK
ncbi:MAG: DUF362 domain-containing protein [Desulfobacterales bacterium]|jgi:uncharacterized Fe-S center protein|nr:DUF362 domain-containing protein [Desulfobacterales bacterium]